MDVMSATAIHFHKYTYQHLDVTIPGLTTRMDVLVVVVSTRGPPELFVLPVVITAALGETLRIFACCVSSPWFLPGGAWVAQVIPLPGELPRCCRTSSVFWTEVVGANKPTLAMQVVEWEGHSPSPGHG